MSDTSDADLLNIFWGEVNDYLQSLNSALLQIETATAQDEPSLLREMNRFAHSMKGAARAVGISVIETIGHYMEEIFQAAANNRLQLTPTVCDLLYDGMDLIQNVVGGVENDTDALAGVLARLEQTIATITTDMPEDSASVEVPVVIPATPVVEVTAPEPVHTTATRSTPITPEILESGTLLLRPAEETIRIPVSKLDQLMGEVSELLITKMHGEERQRDVQRLQKLLLRWQREWRSVRTAYIRLARRPQGREPGEVVPELALIFKFLESNQRYLLETNRHLSQLTQGMAQYNSQLSMLAEQLQDDIGRMRLVPFESVLGGFQRMVRDLARDTGKQIHLDFGSTTVEMDKATLDALKEPIMHLLRNSVDHGIESAEERERAGKPPMGQIQLKVEQRGKEIVVTVADDGKGLDTFRIGRAAVSNGLLSAQELANLSDDEIHAFIFHPGLSTSERVTTLSGRGMGMDIVRTRIESLRGRVHVQSVAGKGTTFSLSIPVSLTRMSCVLLRIGDQNFAVPSVAVSRMVKMNRDQVFTAEGREMIIIQGQPTPLIPLHALLNIPADDHTGQTEITLLVLALGERSIAFEVDALYSEQELVLKPLGQEIEQTRYISGAALLGTGDVIIVLDANDLLRSAMGVNLPRSRSLRPVETKPAERERLRVLVVDDSITTRTLEKHILETAGFDVRVAVDGSEAWAILGEADFDVVIADVEMPKMTGLELTRQIKNTAHTQHLPVVLLTSLSKPEQREAGLRAGADAYLVKSKFDQAELLQVIQAVL